MEELLTRRFEDMFEMTETTCPECTETVYEAMLERHLVRCREELRYGTLLAFIHELTPMKTHMMTELGRIGPLTVITGGFTFTYAEVREALALAAFTA